MNFDELIRNCDFDKLDAETTKNENLLNVLSAANDIGILGESILGYYTCLHLLNLSFSNCEKATIHNVCAIILSMGINFVTDAYALGFYHAKKAMELDPQNIEYKQSALKMFADIPDFHMNEEERKAIVRDILQIDPCDVIGLT